jgi:hypothetical protein
VINQLYVYSTAPVSLPINDYAGRVIGVGSREVWIDIAVGDATTIISHGLNYLAMEHINLEVGNVVTWVERGFQAILICRLISSLLHCPTIWLCFEIFEYLSMMRRSHIASLDVCPASLESPNPKTRFVPANFKHEGILEKRASTTWSTTGKPESFSAPLCYCQRSH